MTFCIFPLLFRVMTFECIDGHTCGNPVRLVVSGGPELKGKSMNEKRLHFLKEFDWIRTGLMFEPRGHDMMSGSILYPPLNEENDIAVLFIETSGCLPMCGHGTIGTLTIALQEGLIRPKKKGWVRLETPAGLVIAQYREKEGKILWVKLTNVKSYLVSTGLTVESETLGQLYFDVAYGGNFYAIFDPQKNFSGMQDFSAAQLVAVSQELRPKINRQYPNAFLHPEHPTIKDVSHMLWTGKPLDPKSSGRNAVFYGDKAIDRSPCGTGTSARMAQLHAKGLLALNTDFVHESIIGSTFVGSIQRETSLGPYKAVVPTIQGWAKVYGKSTISIDPDDDPYAHGFQVI